MTPSDALTQALDTHEPPTRSDAWVRHERGDCGYSCSPAILAALPPGWRLCGPDDVTVTVERLARAVTMPKVALIGYPFFASPKTYAAAILAALSADKEGQK